MKILALIFFVITGWVISTTIGERSIRGPMELTIASSSEEPASLYAHTIVSLLEKNPDLSLTLVSIDNPELILKKLNSGEIDLALMEAQPGRARYDKVRLIRPLYQSVLHILHKPGKEKRTLGKLIKNKTIYAGPKGGFSENSFKAILESLFINHTDYTFAEHPYDPSIDILFIFGDSLTMDSAERLTRSGYTLFELEPHSKLQIDESLLQSLILRNNQFHHYTIPRFYYGQMNKTPVNTIASTVSLYGITDTSSSAVYKLISAIQEHHATLSSLTTLPVSFEDLKTKQSLTLFPLHEGAHNYINRDAPLFIERYAESLGVLLSVIVVFASALHSFSRWKKQSKKDTLDEYYQQILNSKVEDIKGTRQEVFDLLIAEKLPANEALIIFMLLYSQISSENVQADYQEFY